MERFAIKNKDYEFEMLLFRPKGEVKVLIQLVHGMAEHVDRYIPLANFLSARGYALCMHNQRGHGKNAAKLGYFGAGLETLLLDIRLVRERALEETGAKKYVLFGHSMGSFMARVFAKECVEPDALILSGTGNTKRGLAVFLRTLALLRCRLGGAEKPAKLINALAFSGYNRGIKNKKTFFDWLSRDEKEVAKYVSDPLCGFMFTNYNFLVMADMFLKLDESSSLNNKKMPIYIFSGSRDPVGDFSKGPKEVCSAYIGAGQENVDLKLYEGARHECLNETNRQEVFEDILSFLENI